MLLVYRSLKKLASKKPDPSWGKAIAAVPGVPEEGQGTPDAAHTDAQKHKRVRDVDRGVGPSS